MIEPHMRRPIKQHEDLLNDPRYAQKVEKHYKVKKREQEEQEAEKDIRTYIREKGIGS